MSEPSPQYYLNKYHEQIVRATKLSWQECVEYAYVKPMSGQAFEVRGNRDESPIPGESLYRAQFLFHTHPYHACYEGSSDQPYFKYIETQIGGGFSYSDVATAHKSNIGIMIVGTFVNDRTAVLRGYSPLTLREEIYDRYFILFPDCEYSWQSNKDSQCPYTKRKLTMDTNKLKKYMDEYMPILETIKI